MIKKWDAISKSLITEKKGFTYRSFGVILKVPYQNMLSAHHEDLMSELNIGKMDRAEFLTRAPDKEQEKNLEKTPPHIRNGMLSQEIKRHQHRLATPETILKNTYDSRNEIIVATRPFINMTEGLPATGEVKIKGYFLAGGQHSSFAIKYPPTDSLEITHEDNLLLANKYAHEIAREASIPFYKINARPDVYDYMNSGSIKKLLSNNI